MKPEELIGKLKKVSSEKIAGIYLIYCVESRKCYVGQSKNLIRRWRKHCVELRANSHHNQHLQNAWNKYGPKAFECYELEECVDRNNRESFWASEINSDFIYNLSGIQPVFPMTEEHKNKISQSNKGRKISSEHKALLSSYKKGVKLSEEHRKKLSESHKGQIAWNKGKKMPFKARGKRGPYSEERRKEIYEKITEKRIGIKLSNNIKEVYKKAQRAKSPITKEKALELKKQFEEFRSPYRNKELKLTLAKKYNISKRLVEKIIYDNHWTTQS